MGACIVNCGKKLLSARKMVLFAFFLTSSFFLFFMKANVTCALDVISWFDKY